MVRASRCATNISENAGWSCRTRIMALFSSRMSSQSVIAVASRHATRLACDATFAAEFIRPKDGDHCFLALCGIDGHLHLSVADINDRIGGIALRKDDLIHLMLGDGPPPVSLGEKGL